MALEKFHYTLPSGDKITTDRVDQTSIAVLEQFFGTIELIEEKPSEMFKVIDLLFSKKDAALVRKHGTMSTLTEIITLWQDGEDNLGKSE